MVCQEGLELLLERRSVRNLDGDKQLPEEVLQEIVKAAVNSPSAHNKQLFHFTVVQDKALLDEMAESIRQNMLKGTPEQVAKANKPGYSPLHHAPTVIFISGALDTGFNVHTDCGIAAGMIIAAATELGVSSCMTGSSLFMFKGESGQALKARLGIPAEYQAVGGVALGYLKGDKPAFPGRKDDLVNYVR